MPLDVIKKEIETEQNIGYRYVQFQTRAEALVPGAGREVIEPLLWDANASVIRADVQADRLVLDGLLTCQAVYRQGEESSLRALSAKNAISQVIEIAGAAGGMLARVVPEVEETRADYENGHMVFTVSIGLHAWVRRLEPVEVITGVENALRLETRFRECRFVKLAAEANETAVLTERAELPEALDARGTLMDWGFVMVDSAQPDLGGVRVKGRATVETLIASGVEGRPAVQVRTPIAFDKLIELPEWLTQDACVLPAMRAVRTQVEPSDDGEKSMLTVQADVHFEIAANLRETVEALEDAYSSGENAVNVEMQRFDASASVECAQTTETVRGVCMLGENAPSAGEIICVRASASVAETEAQNGRTRVRGILTANVLYLTDAGVPAAVQGELPFEIDVPQTLREDSMLRISVTGAEAGAVMTDRVEFRATLNVWSETRVQESFALVSALTEGDPVVRAPGYVVMWPGEGETAWEIGRRCGVPVAEVEANAQEGQVAPGKPIILKA